ncbi:MAG: TonB-dependent receptor [Bacteroidota bacterium]
MTNPESIREELDSTRKALFINLDESIYGSFAEIGGGQEVARCFFQSGGASGTVAKTISAYDMVFSDNLYGKSSVGRYVSEARLLQMLKKEFSDLTSVLGTKRGKDTRFFSFANTVATINFKKTNEAHGWIGVRFQLKPNEKPNDVVLHVRLLENDSLLQQKTLGILGVNLIYACFYNYQYPNSFLKSLMEDLSEDRLEIDMIRMSGPGLDYVDNRLLAVQLVKNRMTSVIMFDRNGDVKQSSDLLYKKNIMVLRGSFRPITYVGFDMLKSGFSLFKKDVGFDKNKNDALVLCEMTLNNLMNKGNFDERDFLDRVDILCGMGQNVMVSNFREFYKLSEWFCRFNLKNIRMIIGALTFRNVLEKKYYADLKGGILEAFGKLFSNNLKIYIYPGRDSENDEILNLKNIPVDKDLKLLYEHLVSNDYLIDIVDYKEEVLPHFSHIALKKIKENDKTWEQMVPKYVSAFIKSKNLFGYKNKAVDD